MLVNKVMQKLLDQFSQNLVERWHMGKERNDQILAVIRIWIWIEEFLNCIFTHATHSIVQSLLRQRVRPSVTHRIVSKWLNLS